MKKILSVFLSLVMLLLLTGCVYDDLQTAVHEDGSGTVSVTLGVTEEAVELLGLQDQIEANGAAAFERGGVAYYGRSAESSFASPEEFNALCAKLSAQVRAPGYEIDPGTLVLLENGDGSHTLSLILSAPNDPAAVLKSRAPQLSEETAASLLADMVMRYTFTFDAPVRQSVGPADGVSVQGSTVTADLLRMQAGTYQFTTTTAPLTDTAYENSGNAVLLDGESSPLPAYYLKDANGNGTNYVKLRDVASLLSGTQAQFEVAWDGIIRVTTGEAYTPNGSEMSAPFRGERTALCGTPVTMIDGSYAALDALTLTDDSGGGYTYYKLRDLGRALGFNVRWDGEASVIRIETDRPYTG